MSNLERIKGSIPPVVTPIRDGEVDYDAYKGLVEFQVSQGSHGLLVNGTTAEPSTLTTEERNRLVDVAVDTVAGKIPFVAATVSPAVADNEPSPIHLPEVAQGATAITALGKHLPQVAGRYDMSARRRGRYRCREDSRRCCDRFAIARGNRGIDRACGESRRRRIADCDALLHQAAAARPGRVLPEACEPA